MPSTPQLQLLPSTLAYQPIGPAEPEGEPQTQSQADPTNAGLSQLLSESQQATLQPKQEQSPESWDTQTTDDPAQQSFNSLVPADTGPSTLIAQPDATNPTIDTQTDDQANNQTGTPTTPAEWVEALQARFEGSTLPGMILAFGVLVLMFIMMRRLAKRSKTPSARSIDPVEHIAGVHHSALSSIPPLERSVAQAEETTRRLAAMLDNKADRIDLLIQEADAKLNQLNNALAQVSRSTPVPQHTNQSFIPNTASQHHAHDAPRPAQRKIDPSLLDRARVQQDRAERTNGHAPTNDHQHPRELNITEPEADPAHRRIWELADDGVPPIEIARTLNQPVGQVELILNLRKSG